MLIASFDIGKKNFAFCIERVDVEHLDSLKNIARTSRYFKHTGGCTPEFAVLLNKVCSSGNIVLLDNVDLTDGCDKSKVLDPHTFINMNRVLDKHKSMWDQCTSFVIEQQMSFGRNKQNIMALKLAQHCFSYFTFHYADFKKTIEFPSYYKTKLLGAPKNMSKPERKRWAVDKAIEILTDRNDLDTLSLITSRKKADDMADVITQLQSFKYLVFVDKSI